MQRPRIDAGLFARRHSTMFFEESRGEVTGALAVIPVKTRCDDQALCRFQPKTVHVGDESMKGCDLLCQTTSNWPACLMALTVSAPALASATTCAFQSWALRSSEAKSAVLSG